MFQSVIKDVMDGRLPRLKVRMRRIVSRLRPRVLDLYLFREFITPFFFTMGAFVVVWLFYILLSELDDMLIRNFTPYQIVYYLYLNIPYMITVMMPVSLLISLLYTLTTLAKNNEIVAMRACGISLPRIAVPISLVALLATGIVWILNREIVPEAVGLSKQMLVLGEKTKEGDTLRHQVQYHNSRDHRYWYVWRYNITRQTLDTIEIVEQDAQGRDKRKIVAAGGSWDGAVWRFLDVVILNYKPDGSVDKKFRTAAAFAEFDEQPRQILATGREAEGMGVTALRQFIAESDQNYTRRLAPYRTLLHFRYAMAFACICVCLLTIPYSASATRRNPVEGIAFPLLYFVALFFFTNFCLAMGKGYRFPALIAAWLPIVLFSAIGGYLLWRRR